MSNYYHLVLHINRPKDQALTDREVVERWQQQHKLPLLVERWLASRLTCKAEHMAVGDFAKFISRVAKGKAVLKEFLEILEDARYRKTFPIRGIHEKLMSYRRDKVDYATFIEEERKMIKDLMPF